MVVLPKSTRVQIEGAGLNHAMTSIALLPLFHLIDHIDFKESVNYLNHNWNYLHQLEHGKFQSPKAIDLGYLFVWYVSALTDTLIKFGGISDTFCCGWFRAGSAILDATSDLVKVSLAIVACVPSLGFHARVTYSWKHNRYDNDNIMIWKYCWCYWPFTREIDWLERGESFYLVPLWCNVKLWIIVWFNITQYESCY